MQWRPCGTVADAIRRPLVVLFPWLWSGAAYVDKYVALLHSLGFDVLLVSWSFTAMWVPPWVRYMAWNVIEAVGKDLQQAGERPVVFYAFSGAAKVRGCCIIFLALFITSMSRPSAACHRLILCQQHRCHTMSSTGAAASSSEQAAAVAGQCQAALALDGASWLRAACLYQQLQLHCCIPSSLSCKQHATLQRTLLAALACFLQAPHFCCICRCLQGVFSSVLSLLARQHPLSQQQAGIAAAVLRCSVGCVYDSCPVDFTSAAVSSNLNVHTVHVGTADCTAQHSSCMNTAQHLLLHSCSSHCTTTQV